MKHVFLAGRRFDKMKNLCILANSVVVFSFYFIYDYLLASLYPPLLGAPLVAIFILIEVVVVYLTNFFAQKLKARIRYEIKPDYLLVSVGKSAQKYPWANFTEAKFNPYRMRDIFAVTFVVAGMELPLNQYVDNIYELVYQILQHTDMKTIDPEVTRRATDLR